MLTLLINQYLLGTDNFGSIFFEKVTDSIRYIMRKHGFNNLFNYVDDLIYCDLPSKIYEAYQFKRPGLGKPLLINDKRVQQKMYWS